MHAARTTKQTKSQNILEIYLREINATPLLKPQEERALAYRVIGGDMEARNQMVRANLRLVVNLAREFLGNGLPMEDMVEEGNLGLLRAVEAFDPTMETRFSTYASYWIKQSIQRLILRMSRTVRVPAYAANLVRKWQRTASQLNEELGRVPTDDEIARRLELSPKKVDVVLKAIHTHTHDGPVGGDENGNHSIEELLADERCPQPEEIVMKNDQRRLLERHLAELDEREVKILRMRYGLSNGNAHTHKEIGESLGLTRQRVRQIEYRALEKLAAEMGVRN